MCLSHALALEAVLFANEVAHGAVDGVLVYAQCEPSGTPVYRPESKKIDLQQLLLQVKQRWTKSDPSTTHAVSLRSTERPGSLRFDLGHHGGLGHRLLSRQQAMTRDRYDMQTQTPSR